MSYLDDGQAMGTLIYGCLAIIVFLTVFAYQFGERKGLTDGECKTRAEFALTGADTLSVLRKYPKCAEFLTEKKDA